MHFTQSPIHRVPSSPRAHFASNRRRHLRSKEFDGAHHLTVRHRSDTHLDQESLVPEKLVLEEDFLYDFRWIAYEIRAAQLP